MLLRTQLDDKTGVAFGRWQKFSTQQLYIGCLLTLLVRVRYLMVHLNNYKTRVNFFVQDITASCVKQLAETHHAHLTV